MRWPPAPRPSCPPQPLAADPVAHLDRERTQTYDILGSIRGGYMTRWQMYRDLSTCGSKAAMVLILVGGMTCWSQINTGRILGTVRDASGAVIPNARIMATNNATGAITAAQSTESGDYALNYLIPDAYRITAEKPGLQRSVIADVVVNAGGITRVDINMAVG